MCVVFEIPLNVIFNMWKKMWWLLANFFKKIIREAIKELGQSDDRWLVGFPSLKTDMTMDSFSPSLQKVESSPVPVELAEYLV